MLDKFFARVWARFHREEGQDLIECALVTALISVGIIVGVILSPLSSAFDGWVTNISSEISGAVT